MQLTESTLTLAVAMAGLLLTTISAKALDNSGFEVPDQGAGGYAYTPAGGSWAFGAGAGLSGPGGPWKCNSTSPDPLGDQFAYLQNAAEISQDLTGLVVGATYDLGFFESYRTGTAPSNDLSVILDAGLGTELTIYNNPEVTNASWEARTTDQFVAAKASYTLTFRTTNPPVAVADRTTIIDGVVTNTISVPGAPEVLTLSPPDEASDVPTYSDLVVTFNKGIAIGSGDITIKSAGGDTVIMLPDSRVSVAGSVLTIDPDTNLAGLTDYAVVIEGGAIEDTSGTPFAGIPDDGSWTFTTAATDTTAPTLVTLSPASSADNVPTGGNLVVTFDEGVRKGTGDIVIRRTDGSQVETINVASATVTISGGEVTINSSVFLDPTRGYYVEIGPGAFEDLTGNPFAGITDSTTWSFVTTAIYFDAISSDADSGIDSANTYTHAIDFGDNSGRPIATINGVVFANGGPGDFPAIGASSQTVGTGTSNLPNSNGGNDVAAPYLADDGMKHLVGDMIFNNTAGQIDVTGLTPGQSYRFRLYHRPWTIGPERVQAIAFDTDGVAGAEHSGVFDEDDASKPDPGFATGTQVNALTYDYTLPVGQTTLTVNINFIAGGSYHLYGLTNEERMDTDSPEVFTLNPADDAVGVPTYSDLLVTFNEGIVLDSGGITIKNVTDGGETVITLPDPRVSVAGAVLTINPDTNLAGLKEFAVVIDGSVVTDLAGNPFGGVADDGSWTFTTGLGDFTEPTVVTLNPVNDAIDVATLSDFVVSFDEPVRKGTGNIVIKLASDGTAVETIDVNSGDVTISGTDLMIARSIILAGTTGYYVQIAPGAVQDFYGNDYVGISDTTTWRFTTAEANDITVVPITGDADSGISASHVYTHKLDFGTGSPGALVNSVQFDAYNNAANGTLEFNRAVDSGALSEHPGNAGHNVTGDLANLLSDMFYNGGNAAGGTTTWTLSGLTAGVTYDARIYTRQWGLPAARFVTLVFDPDGAGPISDPTYVINEDDATSVGMAEADDAYYINYRFTAVTGEDLVITATQNDINYSWHLYGLSNQVVTVYDTWAVGYGLSGSDTLPTANIESDLFINLLEFGFGTDPTVADSTSLSWNGMDPPVPGSPVVDVSYPGVGVDYMARFMRRTDYGTAGSVSYTMEFSSDLTDWEVSGAMPEVLATDGDYQLVQTPYPLILGSGKKARFFRVTVTAL